jgi:hypothetical protein
MIVSDLALAKLPQREIDYLHQREARMWSDWAKTAPDSWVEFCAFRDFSGGFLPQRYKDVYLDAHGLPTQSELMRFESEGGATGS